MQLKPINEQVVVIMGASSGIGRETALSFAERGAKVVVSSRSEEGLNELVQEIQQRGGEATPVVADVTKSNQVKSVAETAVKTYGHLDTWVHAAAVSLYAKFDETTPTEFKRIIEVNLVGQAYGAMAALPHLKREGRGALIHVSSVEAKRAFPLQSAYASSKHGMIGFLDALRLELQSENIPISVTNVMPAGINTPLFNNARTKMGVKPMPAPPIYQPGVVADVILYAAEHPTRDIVAGGAAKGMIIMQALSPRVMDALLLRMGFKSQQTDEPKALNAPDNLSFPLVGNDHVEGDFTNQAKAMSLGTWLELHPVTKRALTGVALATIALLTTRAMRTGSR